MKKTLVFAALLVGLLAMAMSPEALKSYRNFEKKAARGNHEAQYRLGLILETGYDTIAADTARAVELFKRSADAGYAPAQNYLGYLYRQGQGVKANPDSAVYWLRMAADAGDPKASANVAYMLLNGEGVGLASQSARDSLAARYLMRASQAGLPTALTQLADLYQTGRGVPRDTLQAIRLYDEAIGLGWSDAELRLLNFMGPVWRNLAKADPAEALQEGAYYYRLGAPTAAVEILSGIVPEGEPTREELNRMFRLANSDDPEAVALMDTYADAYAILGEAYSLGRGAVYDHDRGLKYYEASATLGNPAAQFILAEVLDMFPDALGDGAPTAAEFREAATDSGILDIETAAYLLHNPIER